MYILSSARITNDSQSHLTDFVLCCHRVDDDGDDDDNDDDDDCDDKEE